MTTFTKYLRYLKAYVSRDGIDELIAFLVSSDMENAPASTKYHNSFSGGLVQHSINTFINLINIVKMRYPENSTIQCPYTKESIAIVGLLHDISKVNFYEKYDKNVKNEETGAWEKQECYRVRDNSNKLFYGSHADNSIHIIKKFIDLTYEEELAIKYHMGIFEDNSMQNNIVNAYKISPLALMLNMADMMAICMDESEDIDRDKIFNIESSFIQSVKETGCEEECNEQVSTGTVGESSDVPF